LRARSSRAAAAYNQCALCLLRTFRDDVDDTVDGVGSPQRAAWTSNDFNPRNVLDQRVLDFPIDAGEERSIHAAAVDHHEQLVAKAAVEATGRDGPFVRIDPRHLHAGNHAQQLRDALRTAAADHLGRDHKDRRRRLAHCAHRLRHGRHFHIESRHHDFKLSQLIDVQIKDVIGFRC